MRRTPLTVHALLLGVCGVTVFPFLWMLGTAWKSPPEIFAGGLTPWPTHPTARNFALVLREVPLGRLFFNSVIVATSVAGAQVLTSLLAGYGLVFFRFRGRTLLFSALVATMVVPFQILMIPNYLLIADLHWMNTYQGLIVPQIASGFGIFFLHQHFRMFPASYVEAAWMDGATRWQILWQVVAPCHRTALWSLGILLFVTAWNEYLWPLLVATDKHMQTLPVGIQAFVNMEGGTQWGPLMAAATLAVGPVLLLYIMAQRHIIESMLAAGLRG